MNRTEATVALERCIYQAHGNCSGAMYALNDDGEHARHACSAHFDLDFDEGCTHHQLPPGEDK
jgi:hypothetical protein